MNGGVEQDLFRKGNIEWMTNIELCVCVLMECVYFERGSLKDYY